MTRLTILLAAILLPPIAQASDCNANARAANYNVARRVVVANKAVVVKNDFAVVPFAIPVAVPVATVQPTTVLYSYDAAHGAGYGNYQHGSHLWDAPAQQRCPPCREPVEDQRRPRRPAPRPEPEDEGGEEWREGDQPQDEWREPKASAADFEPRSDAEAILLKRCDSCHADYTKSSKGLSLFDTRGSLKLPLDREAIWEAVESGHMPLGGPELPDEEKEVIRNWSKPPKGLKF